MELHAGCVLDSEQCGNDCCLHSVLCFNASWVNRGGDWSCFSCSAKMLLLLCCTLHLCNYSCFTIQAFGPLFLVQNVLADTCNICIFTVTKSTAHVESSHTVLQEICSAITNTEPGPINDGCNLQNCGKHRQNHDLPEIQTQSFMGKTFPIWLSHSRGAERTSALKGL